MQRSCLTNEVIYTSQLYSEIEFARKVLQYLGAEYRDGTSANGATIQMTHKVNRQFEEEVRRWKDAAVEVCSSFTS